MFHPPLVLGWLRQNDTLQDWGEAPHLLVAQILSQLQIVIAHVQRVCEMKVVGCHASWTSHIIWHHPICLPARIPECLPPPAIKCFVHTGLISLASECFETSATCHHDDRILISHEHPLRAHLRISPLTVKRGVITFWFIHFWKAWAIYGILLWL